MSKHLLLNLPRGLNLYIPGAYILTSLDLHEKCREANTIGEDNSVLISIEGEKRGRPGFSVSTYKYCPWLSKKLSSCIIGRAQIHGIFVNLPPSPGQTSWETWNTILKGTKMPSIIIHIPENIDSLSDIIREGVEDYYTKT